MRPSPEDKRHAAAAQLLLNRVALGLVAEARRRGGFGEDEGALRARAVELAEKLGANDTGADPRRPPVGLKLRRGGRIDLKVPFGDGGRACAGLRADGFVLSGGIERSIPSRTWRPEDMTEAEREEKQRRDLAYEASRGKPKFRGERYLRTVAASAQPGAVERILAAELYGDGLLVEFTYDVEEMTDEQMMAEAESPYERRPPMSVTDDLGTEYYEGGSATYGGGPGVSHSHFTFAPAVPAEATVLRITTDSGTVELDLRT